MVLDAVETVVSTYALFAASVPATGAFVSDILLAPIVSAPVIVPPASGMYVATAVFVYALHADVVVLAAVETVVST